MKKIILVAGVACLAFAQPSIAFEIEDDKALVLTCIEQMDISTTWNQCLNLMFQPCVGETVGSEGHVACLKTERVAWGKVAENLQLEIGSAITTEGNTQLADVLGSWTSIIVQNCAELAAEKSATGTESARLGCEIAEVIGLSGELAACLDGRSTAEYCTFKE